MHTHLSECDVHSLHHLSWHSNDLIALELGPRLAHCQHATLCLLDGHLWGHTYRIYIIQYIAHANTKTYTKDTVKMLLLARHCESNQPRPSHEWRPRLAGHPLSGVMQGHLEEAAQSCRNRTYIRSNQLSTPYLALHCIALPCRPIHTHIHRRTGAHTHTLTPHTHTHTFLPRTCCRLPHPCPYCCCLCPSCPLHL